MFYTLVNKFQNAKWKFKAHDFVLTNDYATIATADVDKQDIFNFRANVKIDTMRVEASKDLVEKLQSQELNLLQSLSKKINTKSLTYAHENFFLYDKKI